MDTDKNRMKEIPAKRGERGAAQPGYFTTNFSGAGKTGVAQVSKPAVAPISKPAGR